MQQDADTVSDALLARCAAALRHLLELASETAPLILCLDDVQYIDMVSLRVLRELCTQLRGDARILVILTYRDDEVGADHPLSHWLQDVRGAAAAAVLNVTHLHLDPLSRDDTANLLADVLQQADEDELPERFVDLVHQHTRGAPLFVRQMVMNLERANLLSVGLDGAVKIDMDRIAGSGPTTYAVNPSAFAAPHILALPESAKRALQVAACVGGRFRRGSPCLRRYPC